MATDTPTRWHLERGLIPGVVFLYVELVEEAPARGYRITVRSRAQVRADLPYLRRLVQSIGEERTVRTFDPVENPTVSWSAVQDPTTWSEST